MKEELKPSELRIGNWVMYNPNELIEDPFAEPIPQYPFRIESGEHIDLSVYGGYHPIPITDEILKAVGAVEWGDGQWEIGDFELEKAGDLYYPAVNVIRIHRIRRDEVSPSASEHVLLLGRKRIGGELAIEGGKEMKTFPSYDYTLCDAEECKKKDTCMRYLTYRKSQEEKYPYRISVLYRKELETECDLYVEAKEETKC